jgi:hypothetical protein
MMTVNVKKHSNNKVWLETDFTKPHTNGKGIGGIAKNAEDAKRRVLKYDADGEVTFVYL